MQNKDDFGLSEPFQNITKTRIFERMKGDKKGWQKASELMLTDKLDLIFDKNPNWPHRKELHELFYKKEPRTDQEERRLKELLKEIGLSMELLENDLLHTYAHINSFQIVPEG